MDDGAGDRFPEELAALRRVATLVARGGAAEDVLAAGMDSAVGAPIDVDGRLWGVMIAASREAPLPPDTETRLAGFTELVATAIANSQARVEVRGFAEEQAALRRVAILVAGGAAPEEVFAAVTAEAGRLLGIETIVHRYDVGDEATVVAHWAATESTALIPVGSRVPLGGRNVTTRVLESSRQPWRAGDRASEKPESTMKTTTAKRP